MSEPRGKLSIDRQRIERLVAALSVASAGRLEVAQECIEVGEEDDFGMLEGSMRLFLDELSAASRQNTQAMEELSGAAREIEEKLRTIELQRQALRELSAPIIDVWEGILTVPLVGPLDGDRAADMMEKLLARVADGDVQWVLIDMTGVPIVDTETADRLLKLASAVQLLGAQCILTGLGSQVARALVDLGVHLQELNPMRSLREGLRYCLARRAPGGGGRRAADGR
ncbi:hypothetical protein SOCE26_000680 [Sorangium cellulosum]|uniref:STAS domain-containing protein n=1 Tax=Sorangium cellulosum TaxID=56 RepID=A0A2L0EHC2_SORCE|nr:STAS domain-containing protein [Sorangium cellulosum]AUX38690.1 hypothetical protein SOCE26_000680 [Sorangium cellulosum]